MHKPATRVAVATIAALCTFATACSHQDEKIDRLAALVPDGSLRTAVVHDGGCGAYGEQTMVSGISAQALAQLYQSVRFDLDDVRSGDAKVPKILLADMPDDLRSVTPVGRRKALFLKAVLPAVLFVDARIMDQRRFVESVRERLAHGGKPSAAQRTRLAQLAQCYGVDADDFDGLLRRVDIVPAALSLAQAAIESRWGTSRFARDGNAILGQHTTSKHGLAPSGIRNADFRVQSFGHLPESVGAFMQNLNTHPAYRGFRAMRARMRRDGKALDSMALAGTLLRYSTRRAGYVSQVRTIIRSNKLLPFDDARLTDSFGGTRDTTEAANSADVTRPPQDRQRASSPSGAPGGTG